MPRAPFQGWEHGPSEALGGRRGRGGLEGYVGGVAAAIAGTRRPSSGRTRCPPGSAPPLSLPHTRVGVPVHFIPQKVVSARPLPPLPVPGRCRRLPQARPGPAPRPASSLPRQRSRREATKPALGQGLLPSAGPGPSGHHQHGGSPPPAPAREQCACVSPAPRTRDVLGCSVPLYGPAPPGPLYC